MTVEASGLPGGHLRSPSTFLDDDRGLRPRKKISSGGNSQMVLEKETAAVASSGPSIPGHS